MKNKNQKVIEKLNKLLADYQIFYQNLRGLHWNVKGPMFFNLHAKYEEYYDEAAEVIDEIAERVLMLRGTPLHTFDDYMKTATLKAVSNVSDGKEGIKIVLENKRFLLNSFNDILETAAEAQDEGTAAMMSEFIGETEKNIWMLESFLS